MRCWVGAGEVALGTGALAARGVVAPTELPRRPEWERGCRVMPAAMSPANTLHAAAGVRAGRLELPPLSRPGPKPGASANSATLACAIFAPGSVASPELSCVPRAGRGGGPHGQADSDRRLPGARRRPAAPRGVGGGRLGRALLRPAQRRRQGRRHRVQAPQAGDHGQGALVHDRAPRRARRPRARTCRRWSTSTAAAR